MEDSAIPRRRLWPVFVMPGLLVLLAIGWSIFWYVATTDINARFEGWKVREARSGRSYDCGQLSVGGYPFRFEVQCNSAKASLTSQTPSQTSQGPIEAQVAAIRAVAQVYDPKLMIAEFDAPATVAVPGQPTLSARWTLAQASVYGLPEQPQRIAMVFDKPAVDRVLDSVQSPLARAKHVEIHGRIAEGSVNDHPVVDAALELDAASADGLHPLAAQPFDFIGEARLRGLSNLAPKPWPDRFREIQAAGGSVEVVKSRLQQGGLIAVAAGTLRINVDGNLDGELKMTVAGIEKLIAALGLDKIATQGVPQATLDRVAPGLKAEDVDNALGALDKLVPGLGGLVRKQAPSAMVAGITLLGEKTTLEGRPAQAVPLRLVDGAIFLGPLRIGQAPRLF